MWETGPLQAEKGLIRVGRATTRFQTKETTFDEILVPDAVRTVLAEAGITLQHRWYTPARGAAAEYASMSYQASRVKAVPEYDPSKMKAAILQAVKHYPTSRMCLARIRDPNFLAWITSNINPDAGPGYPFGVLFKMNSDIMEHPVAYRAVLDLATWRAETIAKLGPEYIEEQLKADPSWAVRVGLCDPMRIFNKLEPHKYSKVVNQRWRLIFSESIVDQIVERMLFTVQDAAEIAVWPHIPSKSGMGLQTHQVEALLDYAERNEINFCTDVEGWDWNAPDQLIRGDCECRILLNTEKDPLWESAVRGVTVLHTYRLLMLSNGLIYRREIPGGQASGRKITSSSNGRARFLIDVCAAQHFGYQAASMTQGDDDVTHLPDRVPVDEFISFVESNFGIRLTEPMKAKEFISFCSQRMFRDANHQVRVVPENPEKQVMNFLMNLGSPDRVQALAMLEENFRDLPEREGYVNALTQGCVSALTQVFA